MTPGRILAAILSGLAMALAFPHWNLWPAAWVGLVPLLWALREGSPRQSAILAWVAGTAHYGLLLYWLVGTMRVYGHMQTSLAAGVMLLLVLYLAAFWGAFGAVTAFARSALGISFPWVGPPLWCALEALRNVLFSGFPWALLGYSQWQVSSLIQIADLTGIYGVSFLLVWINGALLDVLESPGHRMRAQIKSTMAWAALALVMVGSALAYGLWRIPQVMDASDAAPRLPVGVAQGNIEQTLKWNPAFQEATLRRYTEQTRRLVTQGGAKMVVWPETAAPFFFQQESALRDQILDLSRDTGAEILFGAPAFGGTPAQRTWYNRAYLVGPDRQIKGTYDKQHLVPFGEYVPLQTLLPFVRRMVESIGDFTAGQDAKPLLSATGASVGVLICFESLFPEISREFVRNGADLLANITNDAWFGQTAAPHQHLSILTLRAVENRRWIVRAANTGISALVDPCGRVVSTTPLFQEATFVDSVSRLRIDSWYTRHGDRFVHLCSLWAGGLFVLAWALSVARGRR
jgi:apolipoprotein N-acyltransferase